MEKPHAVLIRTLFIALIVSIISSWIGFVIAHYLLLQLIFLVPFGVEGVLILICIFSLKRYYTLWKIEIPLATVSIANFSLTSVMALEKHQPAYWLELINVFMIIIGAVIIGRSIVHLNVDFQKRIQPNKKLYYPNMRRDNANSNIMAVIILFGVAVFIVEICFYQIIK